MKKLVWFLVFLGVVVNANMLVVKDGNVSITINSEEKNLTKDTNISLEEGSVICFKKGSGRIVINGEKQLNSDSNGSCEALAVSEEFNLTKWFNEKTKGVMAFFSDSKEEKGYGVGARDVKKETVKQETYTLTDGKKEIIIYSESYGPLPVTLTVKDANQTVVQTFVNEKSLKTFFRVSTDLLDVNYTVQVTNAFDEVLLDVLVVDGNSSH